MGELDAPIRRRPRYLRWVLRTALLTVALIAIADFRAVRRELRDLDSAIAELDAADPGWHIADIEAARAQVPDAENSATVVQSVYAKLPRGALNDPELSDALAVPPECMPPEASLARVREQLESLREAVTVARLLADRPRGRFPIRYSPNPVGILLDEQQKLRAAAMLLGLDSLRLAHDRDGDGALQSARAAATAAEALADEPTNISQLIRIAVRAVACRAVERTLGQCEPSEAALAEAQALLDRLEPKQIFAIAARGDRAMWHEYFDAIGRGTEPVKDVASDRDSPLGPFAFRRYHLRGWHANYLTESTRQLVAASRPEAERWEALRELESEWDESAKPFVRSMLPTQTIIATAESRCRAGLRAHVVLLAAERFRRARGKLPATLDDLVPTFLAQRYADPFDGQPLRLHRDADKLVVYAVGPDGADDNGTLAPHPHPPGTDIGCTLWDMPKRRQPPPPPKPAEPEDKP